MAYQLKFLTMKTNNQNGTKNCWGLGFNRRQSRTTIKWGLVAGIIISVIEFPYKIFVTTGKLPDVYYIYLKIFKDNYVFSVLSITILIPFFEELIFRGWLYRFFRKYNLLLGYVVSTFLFVLLHNIDSGAFLCAISSLILTFIYEKTKSLGASIIAHIMWNTTWYAGFLYNMSLRGVL